jgi:hypothetical protein
MRHGPGKFEACGNYALVAQWLHEDGFDEDLGEAEWFGWYARFSGKIKGRGPFHAIVYEDSQGFVEVIYYSSANALETAWYDLETEWREAQELEEKE